MGPIISIDKSTLQLFSYPEISTVNRHYFINITFILIIEILGDLKKTFKTGNAEEKVKELAGKLLNHSLVSKSGSAQFSPGQVSRILKQSA